MNPIDEFFLIIIQSQVLFYYFCGFIITLSILSILYMFRRIMPYEKTEGFRETYVVFIRSICWVLLPVRIYFQTLRFLERKVYTMCLKSDMNKLNKEVNNV